MVPHSPPRGPGLDHALAWGVPRSRHHLAERAAECGDLVIPGRGDPARRRGPASLGALGEHLPLAQKRRGEAATCPPCQRARRQDSGRLRLALNLKS